MLAMRDGLGWVMAPVAAGMIRYESLKDGSITIDDLADMNEYLIITSENKRRAREAAEKERS